VVLAGMVVGGGSKAGAACLKRFGFNRTALRHLTPLLSKSIDINMAPSQYSVMLQHGITGGFAPPTPNAIHTLSRSSGAEDLLIQSLIRPSGTPNLLPASLTPNKLSAKAPSTEELIDELQSILKAIPASPEGSKDIYGLDTMILFESESPSESSKPDTFKWANAGPQGCAGGYSEHQATDEDKAKFKRAVDIVTSLVGSAS